MPTRKRTPRSSAYEAAPTGIPLRDRLFDARPDRLDFRDLPYRPPLRSLPERHPTDQELTSLLAAYVDADLILDQGTEGACTGFGLACVVNFLLFMRYRAEPGGGSFERVSPRMIYELARRYDEWPTEQYDGSSCRGALKGWHKHGVCSEARWPYVVTTADGVTAAPPKQGWEADAMARTLGVYYRVDHQSVVDVQAAIRNIGAVYVSAKVHPGWDTLLKPKPGKLPTTHAKVPDIPLPTKSGRTGGHAFALVGYDPQGFIIQNSWGKAWGANGFARILYTDWVANASDAWACALGVPAAASAHRVAATRWRVPAGRSVSHFDRISLGRGNDSQDPWPVDHEFLHKGYEPLSTPKAYQHTIVTGNDGEVCVRDVEKVGPGAAADQVREAVHTAPLAWLAGQPKGPVRLAIYAHGGLNGEESSIDRIRVLAPYFIANGVYPLFLTWRTGPGETLGSMVRDWVRKIPGFDKERDAGLLDVLGDARDRALEAIARPLGRGIWSEMRENAARGTHPGHGLDLLSANLTTLGAALQAGGRTLDVHLLGHSAGSILLGHLLSKIRAGGAHPPFKVASASLFAAACSVPFAVEHYLAADADGLLPLDRLHLAHLDDANEKRDALPSPRVGVYGKSLLYLVSRALDEERKMPLLGMERALLPKYGTDKDQWSKEHLKAVRQWQAAWKESHGDTRTTVIREPSVCQTRIGGTTQATHGSFDNNIPLLTQVLQRIAGSALVAPMEWLDY